MYAIFRDRNKQYQAVEGQQLDIDLTDAEAGQQIAFDEVLCYSDDDATQVGTPLVDGAKVVAEVVGPVKGPKLYIQHFRRRKKSASRTGHRQKFTRIRVTQIVAPRGAAVAKE